jgi:uncharacterized protein
MNRKLKRGAGAALLAALLWAGADCASGTAKKLGIAPPAYRVRAEKDVMVPMRDGVKLATDFYFPAGLDQAPVVLVRTPYGKGQQRVLGRDRMPRLMAQRGYIFVIQDVRGRYQSEGEFYPFVNDGPDGQDTIAWIEQQPWFNGHLGTYGASYLGTTQWFESPGQKLEAMHLTVTSPNLQEVIYTDGELHLLTVYFWAVMMGEHKFNYRIAPKLKHLEDYLQTLPLDQADDRVGPDVPYFDQTLDPLQIQKIYDRVKFDRKYQEVSAPAVFVAGWYDMFLGPELSDFNRLLREGGGPAKISVLVIGPWGHGMKGGDGSVDYGPGIKQRDIVGPAHYLAWFDHWLKGAENGVSGWPRVRIFVMGENVWRDESEWPLLRTRYTDYYLHSGGHANTRRGDGALSVEPPSAAEAPDHFIYDPLNPVPTLGGNNLGLNLGAYNQARVEDREDVLCYTTPALIQEVEVTGPITATLYAGSDAVDTDFTVKLVDVYPDGKAVNIQDGIARARFRKNDPGHPSPLTPGAVEEYQIDLWATSNLFRAGHRIRVEVSSSNFPRFNRNLNTGEPVPGATRTVKAKQSIAHDPGRPSHLTLPIIHRESSARK